VGLRVVGPHLADAEVDQLDEIGLAVLVDDEAVRRLHVAVDDPGGVRRLQRPQDLKAEVHGARRIEPAPLAREQLPEVAPVEVLHHEVGRPGRQPADVEHLHHVVAVDLGSRHPFVDEPLHGPLERQDSRAHELQGDRRPSQDVGRLGDRTHPPLAEQLLDAVLPIEHFARLGIRVDRDVLRLRHRPAEVRRV
jgi:hypothetical protein